MGGAAASAFGFKGAFTVMALPVLVALVMVGRTAETLRPHPRAEAVVPGDQHELA